MIKIEVNEDELRLVQKHRDLQAKEEAERLANEAKRQRSLNLEEEFKQALGEANSQIKECLFRASAEVDKAVRISNETGIPFRLNITGLPRARLYTPETVSKWNDLDTEILYNHDLYNSYDDHGWEYWNTSSMTC